MVSALRKHGAEQEKEVPATATFARWRNARFFALGAGVILLVWLAVQVSIIGYVSWMQPVTAIAAVVILVLASLPAPHAASRGMTIREAASQFLAERRIAVTGVSRRGERRGELQERRGASLRDRA